MYETQGFPPGQKLAVAYHPGWGHTTKLAAAVATGAHEAGAETTIFAVQDISENDLSALDDADAIIFGAPTYMGSIAAEFQVFAERTSKRLSSGRWRNKVAAGFTNSGAKSGDKLNSLMTLSIFAAQHHMHWVNLGLAAGWNSSTSSPSDLNRLGFWLGAAAQTDVDLPADQVHEADIRTCEYLGHRVAEVTAELVAGRRALTPATT